MDEEAAKRRLLIYTLVRACGVAVFFLGIAVIYTNLARAGGWPRLGAILAILGAVGGLVAPHFVKRRWDAQDRDRP